MSDVMCMYTQSQANLLMENVNPNANYNVIVAWKMDQSGGFR